MYNGKFISVIIAAAGSGSRMKKRKINKQYRMIGSKPMLSHTIKAFDDNPFVDEIIVIVKEEDIGYCNEIIVEPYGYRKVSHITDGGSERQDSIYKALKKVNRSSDIILIHDGARPFIEDRQINALIKYLDKEKAAAVGIPLKDTVKIIEGDNIVSTPDRKKMRAVQTPQGFDKSLIMQAYEKAEKEGFYGTDDTTLAERLGIPVRIIDGSYKNIKITTEEDMMIANAFIERKMMRSGIGYDVHSLVKEKKLIIGGVEIPYEKGLLGHSDADVLIHAIMDALLGAGALGDIGKLFPDTDGKYKDISSIILLEKVGRLIHAEGYQINNIDAVIIAQNPKMASYIEAMRENIAKALYVEKKGVSVKATTTEGLGFIGCGEGIAAQAIASLY